MMKTHNGRNWPRVRYHSPNQGWLQIVQRCIISLPRSEFVLKSYIIIRLNHVCVVSHVMRGKPWMRTAGNVANVVSNTHRLCCCCRCWCCPVAYTGRCCCCPVAVVLPPTLRRVVAAWVWTLRERRAANLSVVRLRSIFFLYACTMLGQTWERDTILFAEVQRLVGGRFTLGCRR